MFTNRTDCCNQHPDQERQHYQHSRIHSSALFQSLLLTSWVTTIISNTIDWVFLIQLTVMVSRFIHVVAYINSHLFFFFNFFNFFSFILIADYTLSTVLYLCKITKKIRMNFLANPVFIHRFGCMFLLLGYCKQSSYEHLGMSFCVDIYFQFSWVDAQYLHCWALW